MIQKKKKKRRRRIRRIRINYFLQMSLIRKIIIIQWPLGGACFVTACEYMYGWFYMCRDQDKDKMR